MTMNAGCRVGEPVLASSLVGEPFAGQELTTTCPHCGRKLLTVAGLWVQCDEEDPLYASTIGLERDCSCAASQCARDEEKRAQRASEEQARREQERVRFDALWLECGMPRAWRERGMGSWVRQSEAQQVAYDVAVEFGRQLQAGTKPGGLFIAGDIGTGKTMLASCLAADLLRRGRAVLWSSVSDVLRELRECFGSHGRISEAEVLRRYTRPGLLVLDDLGKERPTEWALEQLFCVVNARYDKQRPLVVTTNYGGEELVARLTPRAEHGYQDDTTARAIVDRLREMCCVVKLEGESWRSCVRA